MVDNIVCILHIFFVFVVVVMLTYAVRHFIFTFNRLYCRQKFYYQDIVDSDLPKVTVLIPMHNEEQVVTGVLDALLACDYPAEKLEIKPVNDHSEDKTKEILDEYQIKHPNIVPLHREKDEQTKGKPAALNDAMKTATGDIIIVFDADYLPGKGLLKVLATAFADPEVGAVMGRVTPVNTRVNLMTRLLELERSGGYQVDQQARYNLDLLPQYGGTVGGYRKDLLLATGGFNTKILAEDTELTYRFMTNGWKIAYANGAECYEEAPEDWGVRARQVNRWARGHNEVMFHYMFKLLRSRKVSFFQKLDGFMLLTIYMMPVILILGILDSLALFFLGRMDIMAGWWVILFVGAYNTFGNFAPFFQIGTAVVLDGSKERAKLLPYLSLNFYFYMWYIARGFVEAIVDVITRRNAEWKKTVRYRKEDAGEKL